MRSDIDIYSNRRLFDLENASDVVVLNEVPGTLRGFLGAINDSVYFGCVLRLVIKPCFCRERGG